MRLLHQHEQIARLLPEVTERYSEKQRFFAVISWGAAATQWLSRALSDCPGVYCSHWRNTWGTEYPGLDELDAVNFLKAIASYARGAVAVGNVHGVLGSDVPALSEAFGNRFRSAVLVRDPLPRLRSQLGLFAGLAHERIWSVDYLKETFPAIEALLPTGAYEEWLFVHGANMLNNILYEQSIGPIFRMEDVTTTPAALIELAGYLTDGCLSVTGAWAEASLARGAMNEHAGAAEVLFIPWQRLVLKLVVDERAIDAYRALGYDPRWT